MKMCRFGGFFEGKIEVSDIIYGFSPPHIIIHAYATQKKTDKSA